MRSGDDVSEVMNHIAPVVLGSGERCISIIGLNHYIYRRAQCIEMYQMQEG